MRAYHFSEEPYPEAWTPGMDTLRITLPNEMCDPQIAAGHYHKHLDLWQLADEVGLDVFINEHHSTATCLTASANVILSILARTTKRARLLGLGFPIATRPDPVRLAEELAMIDVISRGRLEMGFIKGIPFEYHPANQNAVDKESQFLEAQDLVIKAMATRDGPFSWEGEHFHYRSVNIWPRPWQDPHPPVWNSCLSPSSARLAGRNGFIMSTIFSGWQTDQIYNEYRRGWAEAGRPEPIPLDRFGYSGLVAVGKSREEGMRIADELTWYMKVNAIVAEPFRNPPGYISAEASAKMFKKTGSLAHHSHMISSKEGKPIGSFTGAPAQTIVDGAIMFAGSPDDVFEQLVTFYEHVGGFGHFLMMAHAGPMTYETTAGSLQLFASEVLPRLQDHLRADGKKRGISLGALG